MKLEHDQLARFEQHQANVAAAFNNASEAGKQEMRNTLTRLKTMRVSSVGGLRGLFPNLTGRLSVTKEGMKNER